MTTTVHMLTGNAKKVSAARAVLTAPAFEVVPVELEVPEIQSRSGIEIARFQAQRAAAELGVPVFRDDHATSFAALNGMPGTYAADFEAAWPIELLLELIAGRERSSWWVLSGVYAQPDGDTFEFTTRIEFTLSSELRGDPSQNWNRAMVVAGDTKTLAEYPDAERLPVFQAHYEKLRVHLVP